MMQPEWPEESTYPAAVTLHLFNPSRLRLGEQLCQKLSQSVVVELYRLPAGAHDFVCAE